MSIINNHVVKPFQRHTTHPDGSKAEDNILTRSITKDKTLPFCAQQTGLSGRTKRFIAGV